MNRTRVWSSAMVALFIMALLGTACGPEMATPTPRGDAGTPAATVAAKTPVAGQTPAATQTATAPAVTLDPGELPVDPNDWHALGPADAKVTIVEYSDFQ